MSLETIECDWCRVRQPRQDILMFSDDGEAGGNICKRCYHRTQRKDEIHGRLFLNFTPKNRMFHADYMTTKPVTVEEWMQIKEILGLVKPRPQDVSFMGRVRSFFNRLKNLN